MENNKIDISTINTNKSLKLERTKLTPNKRRLKTIKIQTTFEWDGKSFNNLWWIWFASALKGDFLRKILKKNTLIVSNIGIARIQNKRENFELWKLNRFDWFKKAIEKKYITDPII